MTDLNLIDTSITPTPYHPQRGDTYAYCTEARRPFIIVHSVLQHIDATVAVQLETDGKRSSIEVSDFVLYLSSFGPSIAPIGRVRQTSAVALLDGAPTTGEDTIEGIAVRYLLGLEDEGNDG